jgi:hypothetical protein
MLQGRPPRARLGGGGVSETPHGLLVTILCPPCLSVSIEDPTIKERKKKRKKKGSKCMHTSAVVHLLRCDGPVVGPAIRKQYVDRHVLHSTRAGDGFGISDWFMAFGKMGNLS